MRSTSFAKTCPCCPFFLQQAPPGSCFFVAKKNDLQLASNRSLCRRVIAVVAMAAAPTAIIPAPTAVVPALICTLALSITPEAALIFVAPSAAASLTLAMVGTECADHPCAVATAATDGPPCHAGRLRCPNWYTVHQCFSYKCKIDFAILQILHVH
jgi:hypothetical protein